MPYNYYEDYKNVFSQYNRSSEPTLVLSDVARDGIAYCCTVLKISSSVRGALGSLRDKDMYWTNHYSVPHLIYKLKGALARHDWAEAIAISNGATLYEQRNIFSAVRENYGDAFFGTDIVDEINAMNDAAPDADVVDVLDSIFPILTKQEWLYTYVSNEMQRAAGNMTQARHDRILASTRTDEPKIDPTPVLATNPFLPMIVRMMMSDTAMARPGAGVGRVQQGRPRSDATYNAETAFHVTISSGQVNKYPMYRRLDRAGSYYVSHFDTYLTGLTDMCRIVEQVLPEISKPLVDEIADTAVRVRGIALGN